MPASLSFPTLSSEPSYTGFSLFLHLDLCPSAAPMQPSKTLLEYFLGAKHDSTLSLGGVSKDEERMVPVSKHFPAPWKTQGRRRDMYTNQQENKPPEPKEPFLDIPDPIIPPFVELLTELTPDKHAASWLQGVLLEGMSPTIWCLHRIKKHSRSSVA